jgi:hypothetical protein
MMGFAALNPSYDYLTARSSARWGRCQPLPAETFPEGIGVSRIGEAIADVVPFVVVPPAATPRLNASFAMEGKHMSDCDRKPLEGSGSSTMCG